MTFAAAKASFLLCQFTALLLFYIVGIADSPQTLNLKPLSGLFCLTNFRLDFRFL